MAVRGQSGEEISYNFEVKPLLSAKCFACHGADAAKRKGKLRLDEREAALEKKAIVAGEPDQSELIKRLLSKDEDEVMPPPEKHSALTETEKDLLRRWIMQGAKYESHWAFIPPVKSLIPEVAGVSSPIDALVRAPLLKKGWQAAPEADKPQWLRRVTFALTGLPPTLVEIDDFVADASTDAYEKVVDRLLKSPHYGERMAINWLDAARYGDTYGRHEDADSEVWPWREWVIKAFNENLPYDKFIQWQMAGDMLPGATQDQIVATAFHRLPVMSNESGSDPEEFRWEQVFDRVKTTSTAVMGITLECARCHDHKYDPFTAKEYYQFAAFLNNIDELGLFARYTNAIPPPTTFVYKSDEHAQHEKLKQDVKVAESQSLAARKEAPERYTAWLKTNAPPGTGPGLWSELSAPTLAQRKEALPRQPEFYASFDLRDTAKDLFLADSDPAMMGTGSVIHQESPGKFGSACIFPKGRGKKYGFPKVAHYLRSQPFSFSLWLQAYDTREQGVIVHRSRAGLDAANRGYELTFGDGKLTATLGHFFPGNAIRIQAIEDIGFKEWKHVGFTYDGSSKATGMKLYVSGKEIPVKIIRDQLYKDIDYLKEWGDLDNTKVADADAGDLITLRIGGRTLDSGLRNASLDELRAYGVELSAVEIAKLAGASAKPDDAVWFDWYAREMDKACRAAFEKLTLARKAENDFGTHLTELMVMKENQGSRRETPFLKRGDFHQPGDTVQPGTPAGLSPFPKDAPPDRRGLAQWMTQSENPLTSRVQVNRLWSLFFGRGIVSTPEDFGIRGQVPSNPALLDYLAVHFMESGWDIKALCREIVLSKTYRQSSLPADARSSQEDPDNIRLARGPSFRLSAEQLRDAALSASGLLNPAIGGRSVNPYQPEGLWEDSGTQHVYIQDTGEKLYRRSLYTFWRRTCPPPMMNMFDAPTREFCLVRRESTLTPLQALALMNDTGFLEAARVLSEKLVRQYPQPEMESQRVRDAFRLLTSHVPSEAQMTTMTKLMDETREYYAKNASEADKLLGSTGASALDKNLSATEVASTLLMTRALFSAEPFVCSY
ncbi:DUF1553 domain-containing protein [soil metagenome]